MSYDIIFCNRHSIKSSKKVDENLHSFQISNLLRSGCKGGNNSRRELVVEFIGVPLENEEVDKLTDDQLIDEESTHSAEDEQRELL